MPPRSDRTEPGESRAQLEDVLQAGFRFAFSLTHHREDAEDLVQRAWVKLHRCYSGCESNALMFRTLRNLFYDDCRRAKIVRFTPLDDDEGGSPIPEEGVLDSAPGVKGDLEVLLGLLAPPEREILFLNCIEGMTAKEIGVLIDRPRNTVLSILARAHQKLRDAAERDADPELKNRTGTQK